MKTLNLFGIVTLFNRNTVRRFPLLVICGVSLTAMFAGPVDCSAKNDLSGSHNSIKAITLNKQILSAFDAPSRSV